MANTKYITGTISSVNENGSGNVLLKMNELEIEKNFNWELDKNTFEFTLKLLSMFLTGVLRPL